MAVIDDNGRPTVALVVEMIRGLRDLMEERTANIQRQLDELHDVPSDVRALSTRVDHLETKVKEQQVEKKDDDTRRFDWRHVNLPTLCLSFILVLASIGAIVTSLLGGGH